MSIKTKIAWIRKRTLKNVSWQYRRVTSRSRSLPDFVVIGAQKCGTTSLHTCLTQHPHLVGSFRKEVHYFDGGLKPSVDNFAKGVEWYCAHFPQERRSCGLKCFESTPLYIFNPLVPERMARLIPDAKLIAVLRNPTDRAISHYFHEKRGGREHQTIMMALEGEEGRLDADTCKRQYKGEAFIHKSYKSRGLYAAQIERFLVHFERNQLLILSSEAFYANPNHTLRKIFRFLDVDESFQVSDQTPKKIGNREKASLDQKVYDYLDDYFAAHNERLFKLIGERFDWSSSDARE